MSKFTENLTVYVLVLGGLFYAPGMAKAVVITYCMLVLLINVFASNRMSVAYLVQLKRHGIVQQYVEYSSAVLNFIVSLTAGMMGFYFTSVLVALYMVMDLYAYRIAYNVWVANGRERK